MASSARSLAGYSLIVVTGIAWAGAWLTAKAAAHDAPPMTVTVGRFLVAAIALFPIWLVLGRGTVFRPTRNEWVLLLAMSLTGTILYTILFLNGVKYAPASDGAVLTPGLAGIFAMTITAAIARTAPAPRALGGAALALAGCILVGWSSLRNAAEDPQRVLGDLLFVGGALAWGIYTVLGKRASARVPAVTSILLVSTIGAVTLAPLALALDGWPEPTRWSQAAILNVLYLGIAATAVAFVTFYAAVKLIGVDRTAPALGLVPTFGVLGAALLLGEELTMYHAAGGALVVAGIVLPNLRLSRVQGSSPVTPKDS